MNINLQNYEEYFVRYIDDELSHDEVKEVKLFLEQHPGLKQELKAFRSVILPIENEIRFVSKQSLKKGITASNCDEYFVRKIEGQLSQAEEKELAEFLQFNPQFNRDLKFYQATKLSADTSIVFPNKNSLKKRDGRVVPIGVRYLLVAAVAASLFVVFMIKGIQWNPSSTSSQTAQQNENTIKNDSNQNAIDKEKEELNSNNQNQNSLVQNNSSEPKNETPVKKEKKAHQKKEEAPDLFAAATPNNSSQQVAINPSNQNRVNDEMTPIGSDASRHIYYMPKQKKAMYRNVEEPNSKFVSEQTPSSPIASFASNVGSDLLRWSGRGDYLPASSYNEQKNKGPLALNVGNDRFGFSTTLFKKRAEKSPTIEKTKTVL